MKVAPQPDLMQYYGVFLKKSNFFEGWNLSERGFGMIKWILKIY